MVTEVQSTELRFPATSSGNATGVNCANIGGASYNVCVGDGAGSGSAVLMDYTNVTAYLGGAGSNNSLVRANNLTRFPTNNSDANFTVLYILKINGTDIAWLFRLTEYRNENVSNNTFANALKDKGIISFVADAFNYANNLSFNNTLINQWNLTWVNSTKVRNSTWTDNTSGINWNAINQIPAGFADGVDDTGAGGAVVIFDYTNVSAYNGVSNRTITRYNDPNLTFQNNGQIAFINFSHIPGAGTLLDLGNASNRWQNFNFSGNGEIGIGLTVPTARITNLQDLDTSNFFDLSSCGTSATPTAIDQTGAVTCSSISITGSQVSDFSQVWQTNWQSGNRIYDYINTTSLFNNLTEYVNSTELALNQTKNSTNIMIEVRAGDLAINSSLQTKSSNDTKIRVPQINITRGAEGNATMWLANVSISTNGTWGCLGCT